MEYEFSTLDIVRDLNVPRERLRNWMNFIKPTIPANGQGTKAIFSLKDVCKIYTFKTLLEMGFKRKIAAKILNTNSLL